MQLITQFFKDMSPIKLALFGLSILIFLIIFIVFLSRISNKGMSVLYSDLDLEDSNKVIQELEAKKIPYQLSANGAVVSVSEEYVVKTRVALAQAGLPSKGSIVGYEIFDKEDSIGTTNFSQNIKLVRALEGEISRTLSGFEQVEKARVLLVLPQKEVFSKERIEPRASIVLKLRRNKTFSKAGIDAIGHLIVTAVPGLEMKNITIVDTHGKSLKLGAVENDGHLSNVQNEEYRVSYENRLKKVIEDLLEQSFGVGKVKAQVAIDMNFDRIVTNSEIYDPDSAVIRSIQTIDDSERTPVSGEDSLDVSVANNIPGLGSLGDDQDKRVATVDKSEQTTNYEISKTIKNHISEAGVIKRLSIGILIDGVYKTDPETQQMEYIPRTTEELGKIEDLVKVAVGFNEERNDKIEVINLQFANNFEFPPEEGDYSWIRDEIPQLFQTTVFAIVVLLVLITVIRPIMLKVFESKVTPESIANDDAMLNHVGLGHIVREYNDGTDEESRLAKISLDAATKSINDNVSSHLQETVSVLRKWLSERAE